MRALVVHESLFGNTQAVADAVGEGLRSQLSVEVVPVTAAPPVGDDVDLLVVGGPTHAFGLSRESTRRDAVQRGGHYPDGAAGLREWLATLDGRGQRAAVFDTRVDHPRLPGTAGSRARKVLRARGFDVVAGPEHFLVRGTSGPLVDGELGRATDWGRSLATLAATPLDSR
jgi:hypothetical protein